jgi:hypothetical protein
MKKDATHKLQEKYISLLDQYGGSIFALNEALVEQAYRQGVLDTLLEPLVNEHITRPRDEVTRLFRDLTFPSLKT